MTFAGQLYEHWIDRGGNIYEDVHFEDCEFFACRIGCTSSPDARTVVRRATLRNCVFSGNRDLGPAVFEDITVENLKAPGSLVISGSALKHVTLRGRISGFLLNDVLRYPIAGVSGEEYLRANEEYYRNVDWALDIRDAKFRDATIRLPARLLRRDPETQVIIRKAKLLAGDWTECDFTEADWVKTAIEILLGDPHRDDEVLIAPRGNPKVAARDLVVFERMRRLGLAE